MGMLTLAGAVSGGGKALQQGLQQTQQYMSQSMLLKEREDMEMRRLDITYGKEAGLLQMRNKMELERDDRQHSRALDLAEQRQDFEAGQKRIERNAAREDAATQDERQRERDVQNKVLEASFQAQRDADQAKRDRAKEAQERQAKREEQQANIGKEIVTETIRNQRPHAGGTGANAELTAQLKIVTDEIRGLEHQILNTFDEKEKARLQRQLDAKIAERRSLGGMPSSQPSRPQYRFPE